MSKDKQQTVTAASNEEIAGIAEMREFERLRSLCEEHGEENDELDLSIIMSDPDYFDWINDALNTSLKAVSLAHSDDVKNFVKLILINTLSYSFMVYLSRPRLQKYITIDTVKMSKTEKFDSALRHFFNFREIKDPNGKGLMDITDKQLKEYCLIEE
jgi:hypothetical protein